MNNITIDKEKIKYIAFLARLELNDSEVEKFTKEFNDILDYVSLINECDVSSVSENETRKFTGQVLQEDIVKKSLISRDEMLQNATERSKNGYIKTRKVFGEE